jgi:phosphoserine phosphatase
MLAAFVAFEAAAESVRVDRYDAIRDQLMQMEVVFFDLDSTLARSQRMFGSDAWFDQEQERNMKDGMSRAEARRAAETMSDRLQASVAYDPVEPGVAKLVRDLQAHGVTVIVLTARREPQKHGAFRALRDLGIDMTRTAPAVPASEGLLYENGVLFANGEKKGPVLERFLKKHDLRPRSMAFVDDKLYNLNSVLSVLRANASRFLAVHYTGADEYNARFNRAVSDYQKMEFLAGRKIPSDAVALGAVRAGGLCRSAFSN